MLFRSGKCAKIGGKKKDGTTCNDNIKVTVKDQCTNGKCAGTHICELKDCAKELPAKVCRKESECSVKDGKAVCAAGGLDDDFATCDDGNDETSNDFCLDGTCSGVDLCKQNQVKCKAKSVCHVAGECAQGKCSNPLAKNGKACDDKDSTTKDDACRKGVCKGTSKCADVKCGSDAQSDCHQKPVCDAESGQCVNPLKADGSTCDDGKNHTVDDACTKGTCAGVKDRKSVV